MDSKFKVIVVGGGPVGLTAAHCLSRAAIDFVLLERRSTPTIQTGANLVLMATGMRILGQLGLADAMADVSSTLCYTTRQDHDGNDMWNSNFFKEFLQK